MAYRYTDLHRMGIQFYVVSQLLSENLQPNQVVPTHGPKHTREMHEEARKLKESVQTQFIRKYIRTYVM